MNQASDPYAAVVCSEEDPIWWAPKGLWPDRKDFVLFILDHEDLGGASDCLDEVFKLPPTWNPNYSSNLWKALRKRVKSVWMRFDAEAKDYCRECSRHAKGAEPYWKLDLEPTRTNVSN